MKTNKDVLKRYNVVLPQSLFDDLQRVADEKHTTVIELLRRFIKLGLLAVQLENTPNSGLIVRESGTEREVILL